MEQLELPMEIFPCKHVWEEQEHEDCLDGPNFCFYVPYLRCKICRDEDWSEESVKQFRNGNK
jgi:hypothetical protein